MAPAGTVFDGVVADYEAGRPTYPAELFDRLALVPGHLVVEGGAGTGIATRVLAARADRVVAFDLGRRMLAGATGIEGVGRVQADGRALPFAAGVADLVCFAQSWHWMAQPSASAEAARVLRSGGRWAAWWSQARADGARWFDEAWDRIEAACPGVDRSHRDRDWGETLLDDHFGPPTRSDLRWTRPLSRDTWRRELRSVSYIAALAPTERDDLVDDLVGLLPSTSGEPVVVPYETSLWVAVRR